MIKILLLNEVPAREFFTTWGKPIVPHVTALSYLRVKPSELQQGPFIFTDLERLLLWEKNLVHSIGDSLKDNESVLNSPANYSGRFGLLKRLHAAGINEFRAFRLSDVPSDLRFPVFIKREFDHSASSMRYIHSFEELQSSLKRLNAFDRRMLKHYMVVECCDVSNSDGYFRKYSAIKIGDALIPRHTLFSRKWVTKDPDFVDEMTVEEENKFIEGFPGRETIERAFEIAGLRYGRVDFGFKNGRPQIWEINTNPVIVPAPERINPLRLPSQSESARRINEAFAALDTETERQPVHISLTRRNFWKLGQGASRKARTKIQLHNIPSNAGK